MRLRVTVLQCGQVRHALLRAPPGTNWSRVVGEFGDQARQWYAVEPGGEEAQLLVEQDRLGSWPLLDGFVLTDEPPVAEEGSVAPLDLVVTEGPDCGPSYPLRLGQTLLVGRDVCADVVLDDPSVSRRHLTVSPSRRGVLVEPVSSTNAILIDGVPLRTRTVWRTGQRLRAGSSTLELIASPAPVRRGTPDGAGGIDLPLQNILPPESTEHHLTTPAAPQPADRPRVPILGWAIPCAVSVVLAVVLRMPYLMLFGLMAPAMSLGNHLTERRGHGRREEEASRRHTEAVAKVCRLANECGRAELSLRRALLPDPGRVVRQAIHGDQLWQRSGQPLMVRVGTCSQTSLVTVDGQERTIDEAPLGVVLDDGVGVTGDPVAVQGLMRSLLLQVLARHPPSDVQVSWAGPTGQRPDWLGWAPHTDPGVEGGRHLVVHDLAADAGGRAAAARHEGPRIVAGTSAEDLIGCEWAVKIDSHGAMSVCRQRTTVATAVRADLLSAGSAARAVRALAPLRVDSTGRQGTGLPSSLSLASLLGEVSASGLARRWRRAPASTVVVLGADHDGPVAICLRQDGPHALVGGTTGSGKSELLRTLIAALALANRPDELVFVLVDYKGGAAFTEAAGLPHTVGMVTDLDPHQADRALTSLSAELKRRERLLAAAGAKDLDEYRAHAGAATLARLVVVIDEFRALAEELPTFLEGLVRIAALGRSLGVHLVLATQRPAGVVSADVRANVNLRIALRLRDSSDSYDVLDNADAAGLPERLPGRALLRTGTDPSRPVQVASVSTADPGVPGEVSRSDIRLTWVSSPWECPEDDPADSAGSAPPAESYLSLIARAAREAARLLGVTPPPSPWLAPLPEVVPVDTLHVPQITSRAKGATTAAATWALADLPHELRQEAQQWDPLIDGHLAVVGAPRTGTSTAIRTLVGQLTGHLGPDQLHLYVFDAGEALAVLDSFPHTGARVRATDLARGLRVIEHLHALVAQRRRDLAAAGLTSMQEQRHGRDPWPVVLLILDSWPQVSEAYGDHARGRGLELLLQVLRDGPAVGVTALLTGDRTLLMGRVFALLSQVWCLRLTDPTDLMAAGLSRAQVPSFMPPGRMVRVSDGLIAQAAVLGTDPAGKAQLAQLGEIAARWQGGDWPASSLPWRAVALPTDVTMGQLFATNLPHPGLPVGPGGDDGAVQWLPMDPATGSVAVVMGPPRSGRTTTLQALGWGAQHRGWAVLSAGPCDTRLHLPDGQDRAGALVLVDDVHELSPAVEEQLTEWAGTLSTAGGAIVVAGDPDRMSGAYRGLAALACGGRTGVILCPSQPADGAALGVAAEVGDLAIPGRGLLVVRGAQQPVQVGQPPSER